MAVYTEVSDEALIAFVDAYDIGDVVAFKGIAEGVENSNYFLQTTAPPPGGRYILTLFEKRVRREDLPFFLGLTEHLARRAVACPTPLHGRDGAALRALCGKPATIFTFLDGISVRRITPAHCDRVGCALAAMHRAGRDFAMRRKNALALAGWRALLDATAARAGEVAPGLAEELASEVAALARAWPDNLPGGVIHADLFPDNVLFLRNALSGIIDFYFACNDSFAYDLAICLNAWCFEPDGSFNVTKARRLMRAYALVRPCGRDEIEALPILARGAALRFLLTRLYDWLNHPPDALVRPKDPLEYLGKLRFHRGVTGPGAYGLDWSVTAGEGEE